MTQSVGDVQRPPKRKLPTKAHVAPAAKAPTGSASIEFFAVAVGREPGVYTSMAQLRKQTSGLPDKGPDKGKMKKFDNEHDAEQYCSVTGGKCSGRLESVGKESEEAWLVRGVGRKHPGLYDHESAAKFYAGKESKQGY